MNIKKVAHSFCYLSLFPISLSTTNIFAADYDLKAFVTLEDATIAATKYLNLVKEDPRKNHRFPPNSAFQNIELKKVNSFDGVISTDENNHVSGFNITAFDIDATGVPMVGNYKAVITIAGHVTPDCKTLSNMTYTVKGSSRVIDNTFLTDLESYSYAIFDYLLNKKPLEDFCQK